MFPPENRNCSRFGLYLFAPHLETQRCESERDLRNEDQAHTEP